MSNFVKPNNGMLRGTGILVSDLPTSIPNANLAVMANNTVKGNISGGSATPSDVSAVSTATASTVAVRDTNANIQLNNTLEGYTTTATASTTTTLTVSSTYLQYFTGTLTQTVVLPVTSTLVLGQQFLIENRSTGLVTVESSGASTIKVMETNSQLLVTVILTTGTTATSWDYAYSIVQGALPVADGGTGDASFTAYAPVVAGITSTGSFQSASSGMSNSGYVLTSTGATSVPTWQAAGGGGSLSIVTISDTETAGTSSQTASSGGWNNMTLTTLTNPTSASWVSLASNQFTLTAGTYFVYATVQMSTVNRGVIRIFDTTNSAQRILGQSAISSSSLSNIQDLATLMGFLTPSATTTYNLQYQVQSGSTNAFGQSNNSFFTVTNEIYQQLFIALV
jgi:hypothetical protein